MRGLLIDNIYLSMFRQHNRSAYREYFSQCSAHSDFLTARQTQNIGLLKDNIFYVGSSYRECLLTNGQES